MKKNILIYILIIVFLIGCRESNEPYSSSNINNDEQSVLVDRIDIGEVRGLDFFNNRLFVATEDEGVYIYDLNSYASDNSIQLSNGKYLETLYQNQDWGINKDIRNIHYSSDSNLLFALDRFGYTYHGYLPYLIGQYDSSSLVCIPGDTLIKNECAITQTHATAFIVDESNLSPELYILYKHNADNELYTENSYSSIKFMEYYLPPSMTLDFCELFAICDQDAISIDDSLSYSINDIYKLDDKLYFANSNSDNNSFEVYNVGGDLIDEYITESEVKSIYAVNDFIVAGTRDGCYITLLEDSGISSEEESKLLLAENFTIYDIIYDNGKLILSAGSDGVIIYDWDGQTFSFNESLRIFSSYAFTARVFENSIFVATKEGLEIYNIEE
tara:strand:+ start:327 stop:1484 length:1158 start_codon:yes stop_codon:yes gene_type:complete